MIDNTFDEVKEFLGFGPKCQNGGIMNPTSKVCACRKYFVGRLCETKVCFNGGALEKTGFKPIKYECRWTLFIAPLIWKRRFFFAKSPSFWLKN